MNLDIEIDSRNTGKFYHKVKRIGACKARLLARKEITLDKDYTRNYLDIEHYVLNQNLIALKIIRI